MSEVENAHAIKFAHRQVIELTKALTTRNIMHTEPRICESSQSTTVGR